METGSLQKSIIKEVREFEMASRSNLKKRILVQYQGGHEVQTDGVAVTALAGIHQYFEDLNRVPNAESGPKDFFEMASIGCGRLLRAAPDLRKLTMLRVHAAHADLYYRSCFNKL